MRGRWEIATQSGQRLSYAPPAQREPRCNGKRPASDATAGTGACGKRGGAADVQQLRRKSNEAEEPAIRSNRNVEGREAGKPLCKSNLMGEGIRDAVVFLVVTS